MCGIAGLIGRIEPDDRRRITAASCTLERRGSDAHPIWASADAGPAAIISRRRLSILDLRHGADQPMITAMSGSDRVAELWRIVLHGPRRIDWTRIRSLDMLLRRRGTNGVACDE